MDLYKRHPSTYRITGIIDEYESVVWTERFVEAGEISLVMPATAETVKKMKPPVLLTQRNSQEVMLVDTHSIEDSMITYTGKTLEGFFDNREIDKKTYGPDIPGVILADMFTDMQWMSQPDEDLTNIVNSSSHALSLETKIEKIERGSAYTAMLEFAKKHQVGMAVYLRYLGSATYRLEFNTWYGDDKRDQIMFAPALDNFANVKELYSLADSKSIARVYPDPAFVEKFHSETGFFLSLNPRIKKNTTSTNQWTRRIISFMATDIEVADVNAISQDQAQLKMDGVLDQKAQAALEEHKRMNVVDGEIVDGGQYSYYGNYYQPENRPIFRLGDLVRVGGHFTDPVDVIITEYVTTVDATGFRAFPTVATQIDPPDEGGVS